VSAPQVFGGGLARYGVYALDNSTTNLQARPSAARRPAHAAPVCGDAPMRPLRADVTPARPCALATSVQSICGSPAHTQACASKTRCAQRAAARQACVLENNGRTGGIGARFTHGARAQLQGCMLRSNDVGVSVDRHAAVSLRGCTLQRNPWAAYHVGYSCKTACLALEDNTV
jgi:hypothetical protein